MATDPQELDQAHRAAQAAFLEAVGRRATLGEIEQAVRRCSVKGYTPDVALMEVAVAAMNGGLQPDILDDTY